MHSSIIFIIFLNFGNLLQIDKETLKDSLNKGMIPSKLVPFLNITAVREQQEKHNGSLDFIIRDEDVADIPDDDDATDPSILHLNQITNDGNKTIVKISDDAILQLFQKWIDQATSGLMSAVVTKKINDKKLSNLDKIHHNKCTNDATSVASHAKCVVQVLNKVKVRERRKWKKYKLYKSKRRRVKRELDDFNYDKLNIHQKDHYELLDKHDAKSPFAVIAKHLTMIVREAKANKKPRKKWMTVLKEIKEEATRLKKKKKLRKKFEKYAEMMKNVGISPMDVSKKAEMNGFLDENEEEDDEPLRELTDDEKATKQSMLLLREGVKLGMALTGQNVTNFDRRKINIFSPQFMSVAPDDQANDTVNLLSPSVLSLHEQGTELEKTLSMSRALSFLSETGQEEWMDFVLEASGVTEAVDKMRENEQKEEAEAWFKQFINDKGQPMYFTRKNVSEMYGEHEATKIDKMEELFKSMSSEQMQEMNSTGFSIMNKQQITGLYGRDSPYFDEYAHVEFSNMSKQMIHKIVEQNIRKLANEEISFKVSRKKDITLTPIFFSSLVLVPNAVSQPVVLSPLVFSPLILSPSALGPLILSPWIFTPQIVSPRVLGPIILSPTIFSPLILSPLCLSPLILSPAVAVPLILSPFVLTPFILSPLVMVPVILNPFCLSPMLGVPNSLSPIILSPFVLSPFIFSPPIVNAFVLSPYLLSPILLSDGFLFTSVLSPAILS